MPFLNGNAGAFNSNVKLLKLHNSYFVVRTCICILFLPERWKCYKQLTQLFLVFFSMCAHSLNSLPSTYG